MPETRRLPSMEYRDFSLKVHDQAAAQHRVIKAQLELTYRCNLHCAHCYTDPYNAKEFFPRELTTEKILRLIDEMADLGIMWLNLTGGEIFMHPRFFEIYEYAHRKGFLLMLYTNGTLFTPAIIERLRHSPPFSIDVSCHSVQDEAFDRFTQVPGSFRAFLRGMDLLKDSGLPFCFKTLGMAWNHHELGDIQHFVESFDQHVQIATDVKPRLNGDREPLHMRLSPDQIVDIEQTGYPQDSPDPCHAAQWLAPPSSDGLYRCGCGTSTIHINAWGELGTCTMQYEHRISLHTTSLASAIEVVFTKVRAQRYQTETPCRSCRIRHFCETSPADALHSNGSVETPVPHYCDVALARAQYASQQPLLHPLHPTAPVQSQEAPNVP